MEVGRGDVGVETNDGERRVMEGGEEGERERGREAVGGGRRRRRGAGPKRYEGDAWDVWWGKKLPKRWERRKSVGTQNSLAP